MVSEETARRIADALERLADVLAPKPPVPGWKCFLCGGDHDGWSCPRRLPSSLFKYGNGQPF